MWGQDDTPPKSTLPFPEGGPPEGNLHNHNPGCFLLLPGDARTQPSRAAPAAAGHPPSPGHLGSGPGPLPVCTLRILSPCRGRCFLPAKGMHWLNSSARRAHTCLTAPQGGWREPQSQDGPITGPGIGLQFPRAAGPHTGRWPGPPGPSSPLKRCPLQGHMPQLTLPTQQGGPGAATDATCVHQEALTLLCMA